MRTFIEKNQWVIVTSIFTLVTTLLFWLTSSIKGPFIFIDEADYHWLASEIYNSQKFYSHQYNPLYPLIIAPTFYFNDFATHFFAIKLINITAYVSIIFPVYLISREVLASKLHAILLALISAIAHIGAYSHMVWADPLYYTLICWGYYFFSRYLIREKKIDIIYAGMFIGLGFLAKQAALFFLISIYVYAAFAAISGTKKFDRQALGLLTIGVAMFAVPWLIRNTFFGESTLGYSTTFSLFFESLKNTPLHFVNEFFRGLCYSFGYWIFVYFGVGYFLLINVAFKKDQMIENRFNIESALAKIVLIHALFLMIVAELLFVPYGNPVSSIGRYVDVIYPIALIVITSLVLKQKQFSWVFMIGSAFACFVILLLFSPLTQVKAFGVTTNSGVSILNIFWPNQFLWESPNLSLFIKFIFSATLTTLFVIILAFQKNAIWIIYLFSLLLGAGAHVQATRLGETTNPRNQTFLELEKQNFSFEKIVFDHDLKNEEFPFYMKFWHPTNYSFSKFADPIDLVRSVSIDFGSQENTAGSGEMKIWAPWNPESRYNKDFGSGYNDITTLNAEKCPEIPRQGDFVFDKKSLEFNFRLPTGNYILRGKSADTRCLGVASNFTVQVRGGDSVELNHNAEFILPFNVTNAGEGLKMALKPVDGFIWALDEISIEPLGKNWSSSSNPQYVLSKRLLPLPQVFKVFDYRLYKTQIDF